VIQHLAIGETYFFRDRRQFDVLRHQILPSLLEARRRKGRYSLNVWSVGCASGEELYSIAILLHELLPAHELKRWSLRLVGTDLNKQAIKQARLGIYRPWSFRQTESTLPHQYFTATDQGLQIKAFLREMVSFRLGNVLQIPPLPECDLVLCRNVLLYFEDQRAVEAEARMREVLAPDGWLMLGPAEAVHTRDGWNLHLFSGVPAYRLADTRGIGLIYEPISQAHGGVRTHAVPDLRLELGYEAAVHAHQRDEHEEARSLLRRLLTENPRHARAYLLLAALDADQNHAEEAHRYIDAALQIEPMLADAYYLRGLLHSAQDRAVEAENAFRDALYCQRNHPLAALMLGTINARAGDLTRAMRLWKAARRSVADLKPDSTLTDISDLTVGQLTAMLDQQLATYG
jgi:chemotaxis protein methyltransferase CheR